MRIPHEGRRSGRLAATVALALSLACACASGPAPRAPGAAGEEYLPLVSGMRWTYQVESHDGSDRLEVIAHGTESVRGSPIPLFLFEERMDGRRFGLEDSGWVGYFQAEGFWRRYAAVGLDKEGGFRLFGSGAVRVLPIAPHAGDSWEETVFLFENPESRGAAQHWSAEISRSRSLRTPAGTFRDVLVVRLRFWDPTLSRDRPLLSYEDSYARGVGLVHSRTHNWIEPEADLEQTLVRVDFPDPAGLEQ